MKLKDFDHIAKKANAILEAMNKQVQDHKDEFGAADFHLRLSKKATESLKGLSRNAVEKAMTELEEGGYSFKRKPNGNLDSFSLEDVIAIYKQRGVPRYRDMYDTCMTMYFNNLKGGAGKSSACVNTAHALRTDKTLLRYDLRILVIDLDPQASATMFLKRALAIGGQKNTAAKAMFAQGITRDQLLSDYVFETDVPGVHVMPAAIDDGFVTTSWLEECESKLDNQEPHSLLKENIIDQLCKDYDQILVDTGPHLDFFLLNSLVAADVLVTPLPPVTVDFHSSLKYLSQLRVLMGYLQKQGIDIENKEVIAFMNKFSPHIIQHQESLSLAKVALEDKMLDVHIPEKSGFQRCGATFDTVVSVDPSMYDGDKKALKAAQDSIYEFSRSLFSRIELIRSRN
ncbi:AAA family ATPase [Shewanella sp. UCD-KL12]|uniref:AAA family ATPase n=1 Tax=Shewanella sp. UCD-KL12 TaxID=1917163 RepID=UPI000970B944|nr:AAA family ATPase [Shewanella sp. UCD-KL12]